MPLTLWQMLSIIYRGVVLLKYLRGPEMLGRNDGRTESPELGAEARRAEAPRGMGPGERRRSPSPVWGSGAMPAENFKKSTL